MSQFIDASDSQIAIIEESAWGTTPATPAFKLVRMTGESLSASQESIQSEEIDPRAGVRDLIPVGAGAEGDVNFELSYGDEFALLLEMAFRGTFDADTGLLKAGNGRKSATLEKKFTDGTTDHYFRYAGCRVNTLALNLASDQIVNGTIGFMGKGESSGTAIIAGATYTESNSNDVMSVNNVRSIAFIGAADEVIFTDMSINLNNNLRQQKGFSTDTVAWPDNDSKGIGMGRREVTGNLTAYFTSKEIYDKAINNEAVSFTYVVTDGTNGWAITFPRIKFATRNAQAQGNNSDVFQNLTWQATIDQDIGTDVIIFNKPLAVTALTVVDGASPAISTAGEYVLTSGTKGAADAIYVRRDGMFTIKDEAGKFTIEQVGGNQYFETTLADDDVEGTYVALTGYSGDVPTVTLAV